MFKKNLFIVLLFVFSQVSGQEITIDLKSDNLLTIYRDVKHDSVTRDSLDKICAERGHIIEFSTVTLAYCSPYYIDLPDRTLRIYYDSNIRSGICRRCGRYISQPVMAKPDTVIIWKQKQIIKGK